MNLYYFGTNLSEHGHYIWQVGEHNLSYIGLDFQGLPNFYKIADNNKKGATGFLQYGQFSLFAITGSPVDKRGGTVSVFYVRAIIPQEKLIEIIKASPVAMRIINQIPFEVDWIEQNGK